MTTWTWALVPGVIVYLAMAVAIPVLVDEECSATMCLKRSFELTRGSRWRILGVLLAMCALFGGEFVIETALRLRQQLNTAGTGVEILFGGLLRTVFDMIIAAVFAALYVALRDLRDAPTLKRVFA